MNTLDCIKSRRSIRKYLDKDVPENIVREIIEYGTYAPSSCNTQPWSFIVVRDKDKRKALSKASPYASFVANAPICIVVCLTPEEPCYNPNKYNSVSCAVENMLLVINDYGLGSCWTFVKDFEDAEVEERVKDILEIPEDIEVICMLPIGYPDQEPKKRELKDFESLIHEDKW